MSLLEIDGLAHAYGGKTVLRNASLEIHKGEHMGVVGQNGAGKSTLIGILAGDIVPDKGMVKWQPRVRVGYLDQYAAIDGRFTILEYLQSAYSGLERMEAEMLSLYERYADTGTEQDLARAAELQACLEASDYYSLDTGVDKICRGLGLLTLGLDTPLYCLSGGQRAKVILAKLLLEQPDILLLDEPTNFLDKEHVDWFAGYLEGFPNTFVVVSHDFDFLSRVATCICDVEARVIRKYHGGYQDFLRQKRFLREDHIRQYSAQQEHIKRTEAYIRKNIAGVNTRIAKGRRKQLERLERIAPPVYAAAKPEFHFRETSFAAHEALATDELVVGYGRPLLPALTLTVRNGEKLVVTGFNGIGKSTLLRTLVGEIPALSGTARYAEQAVIGYYGQELVWDDPAQTPLRLLMDCFPELTQKEARRRLSRCAVNSEHALQGAGTLSGGEQAKVKLCLLTLSPCNFLILDEPTNHLDAESKESLQEALKSFLGTIILVSHEEAFYRDWADRELAVDKLKERERK